MRIVLESGRPIVEVARDLGIDEGVLGNWFGKTVASQDLRRRSRGTATPAPNIPTLSQSCEWLAGASGTVNGSFAARRGTPVAIGWTWNHSVEAQTEQWTLQPGWSGAPGRAAWMSSWGHLPGPSGVLVRCGQRRHRRALTKALQMLKTLWSGRTGTLYLRFAREFNVTGPRGRSPALRHRTSWPLGSGSGTCWR